MFYFFSFHRDIIEQNYPAKLKERRESMAVDEKELLHSFSQARTIGARPRLPQAQANRRVGINIPLNRALVCFLVFIFFVTMFVAVSGCGYILMHVIYSLPPLSLLPSPFPSPPPSPFLSSSSLPSLVLYRCF